MNVAFIYTNSAIITGYANTFINENLKLFMNNAITGYADTFINENLNLLANSAITGQYIHQ